MNPLRVTLLTLAGLCLCTLPANAGRREMLTLTQEAINLPSNENQKKIDLYSQAIDEDSKYYLPWTNRAICYINYGLWDNAIEDASAAIALAPENPHYAYVYAVALHSSGKFREALAVLKKAEAKHPSDPDLLGALVAMLREAGEDESALGYARKAAEALPDDESMQRWVRELQGNK